MTRSPFFRLAAVLLVIAMPTFVFAGSIGNPSGGGNSIRWDVSVSGHDSVVLTVSHGDEVFTKTFKAGKPVVFNLSDMPSDVSADGAYAYELRVVPVVPPGLAKKLEAARASNDEKAAKKALKEAGIAVHEPQSGGFFVSGGSIVTPGGTEGSSARTPSSDGVRTGTTVTGPSSRFKPVTDDQVIPDDLIVQGSACVGLDCVNNENFGFDTIRMKENNLRIHFDDTSVSAGFPANDWRIVANDSASGGSSFLAFEDSATSRNTFVVTAGAPANALFVSSAGNVGVSTSVPALDFHINTTDTPAIRLEQNNSGGFTAQTWDVAGNEANFFVRDVTGGSRLSLRIRPGAPTSSIDVSSNGDVGIGTGSPDMALDVERTAGASIIRAASTATTGVSILRALVGNGLAATTTRKAYAEFVLDEAASDQTWRFGMDGSTLFKLMDATGVTSDRLVVDTAGNIGIGNSAPTSRLHVTGDVRVTGGSFIDDGVAIIAPDYVFDESYKLMSIDELSSFIKTNKHLPNVPSAEEFKAKGINLSKLGFNLLEKVEELTLYTVAQHEQIGTLKAQNQQLLDRLSALEAKVANQ